MNAADRAALRRAGITLPEGARMLTTRLPAQVEQPKPGRNKYGAIRTEYNGVVYDSKAEARRAERLDLMVAGGLIVWWIAKPVFRLGCPENKYVADFLVVHRDGVHVEDVKGRETAKFRRDRKLWASYGPCELWLVRGESIEIIHPKRGI